MDVWYVCCGGVDKEDVRWVSAVGRKSQRVHMGQRHFKHKKVVSCSAVHIDNPPGD